MTGKTLSTPGLPFLATTAVVAAMLMFPAAWNGFPLIFPDTGPYLAAVYANAWTYDRSGFYPLVLFPILKTIDGVAGLWIAIGIQGGLIAALLVTCLRKLVPGLSAGRQLGLLAILAIGTSLPWHAAQLMPDAFSGALVLLAWLAVSREPTAAGSPLLWLATVLASIVHVTHIALLATALAVMLLTFRLVGGRKIGTRLVAGMIALSAVAAFQVAANGARLGIWSISPAGPAFLFARLNEDGIIAQWAKEECPAAGIVCELHAVAPQDSQKLLWEPGSPLNERVWLAAPDVRARWLAELRVANRQAIFADPTRFATSVTSAGMAQFARFGTLDDLCPQICADPALNPMQVIGEHKAELLPYFQASPQVRGELPKRLIRGLTFPLTAIGLFALTPLLVLAWRKRDVEMAALIAAVASVLVVNALLTGAFSDVHERYQSRIIWLAPFIALVSAVRWWNLPWRRNRHQGVTVGS